MCYNYSDREEHFDPVFGQYNDQFEQRQFVPPPFGGLVPGFSQVFFGGPSFGPSFGQGFGPPPFGIPVGVPGLQNVPPSLPPAFIPSKTQAQTFAQGPGIFAVDPGAIRPCIFRFVYLWLKDGRSFWAWLVFVGRRSAAGYRWNGFRWVYFGIDLREIEAFVCF